MVDARLPDGSRVNAILPPLAIHGPIMTIRKFAADPYTVKDLINFGTFTLDLSVVMEACVRGKLNILVSPAVPAPVRPPTSTCCPRSSPRASASSPSRTRPSSSSSSPTS